jgi:hypothetical protein
MRLQKTNYKENRYLINYRYLEKNFRIVSVIPSLHKNLKIG